MALFAQGQGEEVKGRASINPRQALSIPEADTTINML